MSDQGGFVPANQFHPDPYAQSRTAERTLISNVPDPTAPESIGSVHGCGIYVIRALMDEVRFEEGGAVIHMRKRSAI